MFSILNFAKKRKVILEAIKIAIVVGTILAFINHYDSLLKLSVTRTELIQILISYFVPYLVATYFHITTGLIALAAKRGRVMPRKIKNLRTKGSQLKF